jgi:hypothetical protein
MSTVRVPRLSNADVRLFIEHVVRESPDEHAVLRFLAGKGLSDPLPLPKELVAAVTHLTTACGAARNSDLEPIEATHSGPVFRAIENSFSDEAIGEVEFWNYLAVRYFWKFISYRQENAWKSAQGVSVDPSADADDRAKLERYFLGKDHYQIPLRMYLRAQAVRDGDGFELTDIPGGSTDFWRSQILGVKTAAYPPVARTVARRQAAEQLNIEQQRPAGRRVNRLRANIDFVLHTDSDAASVIDELWTVLPGDPAATKESGKKSGVGKKAAPTKTAAAPKKTPATKKTATTK